VPKQHNQNSFSPRKLRIPLFGLFLVLGYVGYLAAKPVKSSQIDIMPNYSEFTSENQETVRLSDRLPEKETVKLLHDFDKPFDRTNTATTVLIIEPELSGRVGTKLRKRTVIPQSDGVYVYGQLPQQDKIGYGYIVMEKRQGKTIGALYLPHSDLSCFKGSLEESGELAMTVKGYPGESSSPQVASRGGLPNLRDDEPVSYAYSVSLKDYHHLKSVTPMARNALKMCKQVGG
jgi:hypothetical protein